MTSINLRDMYTVAQAAEIKDREFSTLLNKEDLPDGTKVSVSIAYCKGSIKANGAMLFNTKFKVLQGDHKGGEMFIRIDFSPGSLFDGERTYSDGQAEYNKKLFAKLQAAGISEAMLLQTPTPTVETLAATMLGTKLDLTMKWDNDPTPAEKEKGWTAKANSDTIWSSAGGGAPGAASAPGAGAHVPSGFKTTAV
jgi:hypothetical protein